MDAFAISRVAKLLTASVTGGALRSQKLDNDRFWDRLSFGIIVLGAVLALLTFRDYGVTWDEDAHNWYGNFVLEYYLSFFTDRNALHWRDLYNYGEIFDRHIGEKTPLGLSRGTNALWSDGGLLMAPPFR